MTTPQKSPFGGNAIVGYTIGLPLMSYGGYMTQLRSSWLRRLAEGVTDLVFPASCLACHADLDLATDQINYCDDCRQQMSRGDCPVCRHCASRVPKIPGTVSDCAHCRASRLRFDRAFAFGDYQGLLREQTLAMKTDQTEHLANALGQLLVNRFGEELSNLQLDAVVPAPMHVWRRLARGTNPPAALASTVARQLQLPTLPRLLYRRRNTQPQISLSQPARFRNVRGEIQVRKSYLLEAPHLLLVDDILTTGATCSEAARMLKAAGAAEVTVLVAARTAEF